MKMYCPPSSNFSVRFWQFFLTLTIALVSLAAPKSGFATANYVYHTNTTDDATRRDTVNCGGAKPYVDIVTPSPSQPYVLRFKVEYQFDTDKLAVYYTTDGSTPIGK